LSGGRGDLLLSCPEAARPDKVLYISPSVFSSTGSSASFLIMESRASVRKRVGTEVADTGSVAGATVVVVYFDSEQPVKTNTAAVKKEGISLANLQPREAA